MQRLTTVRPYPGHILTWARKSYKLLFLLIGTETVYYVRTSIYIIYTSNQKFPFSCLPSNPDRNAASVNILWESLEPHSRKLYQCNTIFAPTSRKNYKILIIQYFNLEKGTQKQGDHQSDKKKYIFFLNITTHFVSFGEENS